MSIKLATKDVTKRALSYTYSEVEIAMPRNDADIVLVLPNGKRVHLQWRIENVSLDICLPEEKHNVTCWEGFDMVPSKALVGKTKDEKEFLAGGHVRGCGQLVINFGSEYLEEPQDE